VKAKDDTPEDAKKLKELIRKAEVTKLIILCRKRRINHKC
jgi:hypothetical protein